MGTPTARLARFFCPSIQVSTLSQSRDAGKQVDVCVARVKDQRVLDGEDRNPELIRRNRSAGFFQTGIDRNIIADRGPTAVRHSTIKIFPQNPFRCASRGFLLVFGWVADGVGVGFGAIGRGRARMFEWRMTGISLRAWI